MVVKNMPGNIVASATSITFVQREQQIAANARAEKLLFIGNAIKGKDVNTGDLYLSSGNAEDAATLFGYGSPLHRMALKAYPQNGNGAKVEAYFMPVDLPQGTEHKISVSVNGKSKINKTIYLKYYDQVFEAAADVASKVATNAQKNEARDPRGTLVNIFESNKIPFTLTKEIDANNIMELLVSTLQEYPEVPFKAVVNSNSNSPAEIKSSNTVDVTTLTASDYVVSLKVDNGNVQNVSIGELTASTAQDVIDAVNAKISGAVISATTSSAKTTSFKIISSTSGESSKLEILQPETGTDLFSVLNLSGISVGSSGKTLDFVSKVPGESAIFKIDFVDGDNEKINLETYGVSFEQKITTEGAGQVKLSDYLDNVTRNLEITRVVSQFNDDNSLDALQEYFENLRGGFVSQFVLCYTSREFKENNLIPGTIDYSDLLELGTKRRLDAVNVMICGDYGNLRPLELEERNLLLQSGISNFEKQIDNSFKLMDLCTFYHKTGEKNSIYKYDRDITLLGNQAYDLRTTFESDDMASIFLVDEKDYTDNPCARKLSDIKALVNTRISLWGKAGWIAKVEETKQSTIVKQDESNSGRLNINLMPQLSSVIRNHDIVNLCSIYISTSN